MFVLVKQKLRTEQYYTIKHLKIKLYHVSLEKLKDNLASLTLPYLNGIWLISRVMTQLSDHYGYTAGNTAVN